MKSILDNGHFLILEIGRSMRIPVGEIESSQFQIVVYLSFFPCGTILAFILFHFV